MRYEILYWDVIFEGRPPKSYITWKDWREDCLEKGIFFGVIITAQDLPYNERARLGYWRCFECERKNTLLGLE